MAYSSKVTDTFQNAIDEAKNVGSLDKKADDVGTETVGAPACGDVMQLQIKVGDDGKIADAKFLTYGCGSAIASSSLATEWLKGKTVDEAETIKNSMIAEELNLPPVKIHCSVLAEDAIKSAIANYREKQLAKKSLQTGGLAVSLAPSQETQPNAAPPAVQQAPSEATKTSVFVTPKAVLMAKARFQKRGTPDAALRLGVRGGGCSGFNYVVEVHDGPARARDTELDFDGLRVIVDKKSMVYLAGSVLDWEQTLMQQGFKFLNPQEATACGCGHSFTVK